MLKRGQIQGVIFVLIISLFVVGIIALIGTKSIKTTTNTVDQLTLAKIKNNLANDVSSVSSQPGNVEIAKYPIPSGFDEMCFVDLENVDSADLFDYPLIQEIVASNASKNVFFVSSNNFDSYYVQDLGLIYYPYFACVKDIRNVEVKIEGNRGRGEIKPPVNKEYCLNAENGLSWACDALNITFEDGYEQDCCEEYNLCC